MPAPGCSLIISTYNRADALKCCLQSIFDQSKLPDEVVIADDGSRFETREVIDSLRGKTTIPLLHVWQPDEGYQLARIRNKAFNVASKEYIIQIDGDLMLHKHFVSDHLRMSKQGEFFSGSRVNIDEYLTKQLLSGTLSAADLKNEKAHFGKKHNALYSEFLCRLNYLLQRGKHNYKYVLGCNMSFWKTDLEKVNGYNEGFKGWGKEDNDLAIRLINSGVRLRFIKYGAIVYHLAHTVADLSAVPVNEEVLEKSVKEKITYVATGMKRKPHEG